MSRSNKNYILKNQSRDVRPFLISALKYLKIKNPKLAIDLGCGVGIETCYLAEHHPWQVLAIDNDPMVLSLAKDKARDRKHHNIEFMQKSFEDLAQLPECDFLYCFHSLHFAGQATYDSVWKVITNSIVPDGILAISIFGEQDEMVLRNEAIGISEPEITDKLHGFNICSFNNNKLNASNSIHNFEVIAKKKSDL